MTRVAAELRTSIRSRMGRPLSKFRHYVTLQSADGQCNCFSTRSLMFCDLSRLQMGECHATLTGAPLVCIFRLAVDLQGGLCPPALFTRLAAPLSGWWAEPTLRTLGDVRPFCRACERRRTSRATSQRWRWHCRAEVVARGARGLDRRPVRGVLEEAGNQAG